MRRAVGLLILALLPGAGNAQIQIAAEHRVNNRSDNGVCWWACAEMAGRHLGIKPLETMVQQVVETGVGFKGGAGHVNITHWIKQLGVKAEHRDEGELDLEFLENAMERCLPVVVSVWDEDHKHAILLTWLSPTSQTWVSPTSGNRLTGRQVRFIDPNLSKEVRVVRLKWLLDRWTGRAYFFDPRRQDAALVGKARP